MIAVLLYLGNLYSLTSALKYLGIDFKLIDKVENLKLHYNKIIFRQSCPLWRCHKTIKIKKLS